MADPEVQGEDVSEELEDLPEEEKEVDARLGVIGLVRWTLFDTPRSGGR